jgi:hypothetical protein
MADRLASDRTWPRRRGRQRFGAGLPGEGICLPGFHRIFRIRKEVENR